MDIRSVSIDNFLSFGAGNTLRLSGRGLLLVEGENGASSFASSNGAGKTSLMEAILWGLYGQTSKGVAADEVVNSFAKKDCSVLVVLERGGECFEVQRTRKHSSLGNSLRLSRVTTAETVDLSGVDMKETQTKIDAFLGLGFGLFTNSVYFAQKQLHPFAEYTDKQIKEALMEALDMGRFGGALEAARSDAKGFQAEASALEGKASALESERAKTLSRIEDYRASDARFETERAEEIARLECDVEDLSRKILAVEEELKKADALEADLKRRMEALSDIPRLKDLLRDHREKMVPFFQAKTKIEMKFGALQKEAKKALEDAASVSKRTGTVCEVCGREITRDCFASFIDAAKARAAEKLDEVKKLEGLLAAAKARMEDMVSYEKAIDLDLARLSDANNAAFALKAQIDVARRSAALGESYAKRVSDLKRAILAKCEEKSPFGAYIDEEKERVVGLDKEIFEVEHQLSDAKEALAYSQYWESAFGYGGIPSFLLDAATPFLNERANHYASLVCGGDIRIEFSTVVETKKGVKDKFRINVSHASGAASYAGVSGGEKKRADICVAQAMTDLVRSFGREKIGFIAYDEPFEGLDPEGTAGVIEMLLEVAKEAGTVLVVTHDPALKSYFERTVRVVKDGSGVSRVEG